MVAFLQTDGKPPLLIAHRAWRSGATAQLDPSSLLTSVHHTWRYSAGHLSEAVGMETVIRIYHVKNYLQYKKQ